MLFGSYLNGDAPDIASASAGTEGPIPPKTAEQKLARKNEWKAKSTLLLAIPDEHILKFHGIKQRPYGKQSRPGLKEDANLKLLRSLPSAWNNIALIMRNKSDLDILNMDDLYNNMKVYEYEIKVQSRSSSNSQNVAFVSLENTSSTNEADNTAHEVSTPSLQGHFSTIYTDDVHVFLLCKTNLIVHNWTMKIWSILILMILKIWISNGKWPCLP
ncbi:hypothetical protein Tco_0562594 [Tanacetum coccineum]